MWGFGMDPLTLQILMQQQAQGGGGTPQAGPSAPTGAGSAGTPAPAGPSPAEEAAQGMLQRIQQAGQGPQGMQGLGYNQAGEYEKPEGFKNTLKRALTHFAFSLGETFQGGIGEGIL